MNPFQFKPMFHFIPPENLTKPIVLVFFSGGKYMGS